MFTLAYITVMKTNIFYIHPASIHYFVNGKEFKNILRNSFILKLVIHLAISAVISLILYDFINHQSLFYYNIIAIFCFLNLAVFIKWLKYNKNKKWVAYYIISASLFILSGIFNSILILILWTTYITHYAYNQDIMIDKYLKDMTHFEAIDFHSRRNDMAKMQRIADEFLSSKSHTLKLYNFKITNKNVIFYRAIIETIRLNSAELKIFIGVLSVILIFSLSDFEMHFFVFSLNKDMYSYMAFFVLTSSLISLEQIITKQILKLQDIRKNGMIIPYTDRFIILNYSAVFCIISSVFILISGIVLSVSVLKIIFMILCVNMFIAFVLAIYFIKNIRIPNLIKSGVLMGIIAFAWLIL